MRQGFSLLQISILLTLAALATVTMLPSYQMQQSNSRSNISTQTTTKLNAVLMALRAYEVTNGGKLPCPADASQPTGSNTYGVAAANSGASGNCTGGTPAANYVDATNNIAIGMVPVRALGLPNDYALDAYGRDITYAVDTNATGCWASSPLTGKITITDNGAANNAVAVLLSHGSDGHGAWVPLPGSSGSAVRLNAGSTDADQLTNAHVNSSFVSTTPFTNFVRKSPTATFDDVVFYKNPNWSLNTLPASATSVTISSITAPANGNYSTGQALTFTVTFSAAVTVTGTPQLDLTIGSNTRYVTYQSGSGTTTLTFSYTVVSGDSAPSGISMASSSIDMNGGNITSGGSCVSLNFTAPSLTGVTINIGYTCTTPCIYVADSGNNRVEKFDMSGHYVSQFGSYGTGNGQLNGPAGLSLDSSGNLWALDTNNRRLEKFNSSGSYLTQFGTAGSGNGQLYLPEGMAIDSSGNIWVADTFNLRVQEFNSSGTYLNQFTGGSGTKKIGNVPSVAIDGSGNIWVVDKTNNRVQKWNSSGVWQTQFGTSGYANGQFSNDEAVAIDSSGNIWVSDFSNNRVQKFNSSGTWLQTIPSGCANSATPACPNSSSAGQFYGPYGLAFDSSGNLWVADENNNRIEEFDSNGNYLSQFGSNGSGNGQLSYPKSIAIH